MTHYEWDPAKADVNRAKHGVDFADAIGVFEDERALTMEDTSTDEERLKTLGTDFLGAYWWWRIPTEVTVSG